MRTLQWEQYKIASTILENIYKKYHRPEFIHPDPLEYVLKYSSPEDQEIAGLIASAFALGRVSAILKTVESVLSEFPNLKLDLLHISRTALEHRFRDFKYRFYSSESLVSLLIGIKITLLKYGSLENCFNTGRREHADKDSMREGLVSLVTSIEGESATTRKILPDPRKGSACKRLYMFLRWMVRKDAIDPGPWKTVSPSELSIPLDTHIMQISHILNFTERKQTDRKTAEEITAVLREYDPEDPVRFDFSLSRLGIHPDLSYEELYHRTMEEVR